MAGCIVGIQTSKQGDEEMMTLTNKTHKIFNTAKDIESEGN